jgi:hypothetical protein
MTKQAVIDIASGTHQTIDLSADELVEAEAANAKLAELNASVKATEEQRRTRLAARPSLEIVAKLRDGTALTAAELQAVVRWLVRREIGDELDGKG